MTKIHFSPQAALDLQETATYITEELSNEQAAKNVIAKIIDRIHVLADFPESGAKLSTIIPVDTDYRFVVCGNYTAFYRYAEGVVYVVRILYGRRNFMRVLFGDNTEE